MSNFQHRPIASLADPQPKWRVYGLNKEHVLIVSLKPALYTSDGECQLLLREEDENQDEWIPSLRTAHKQILKIGGYDAYAALLQKTLDELMNYTVGDNPQAMCGSRPRSYKLEQFYIKTDKYSEHRELSYTTALPAVPFPVTQVPGDEFGIRQYVLNESLPRQAGGSAAGGPDGRTVCAGPRFIKIKQLVHDCQGNIKSDVTCWPTAYGNHVLEQSPFVNEIFYDHNTNAIPVSICHSRTLLQAQAWPAGPPGQRILEGIFWRDEATGHFIPIPAQSSQWNLKIESKQADRGKKDFKTLLKFDLRFPRIKKLEALARIKKLEALAKAQSRYIPERC